MHIHLPLASVLSESSRLGVLSEDTEMKNQRYENKKNYQNYGMHTFLSIPAPCLWWEADDFASRAARYSVKLFPFRNRVQFRAVLALEAHLGLDPFFAVSNEGLSGMSGSILPVFHEGCNKLLQLIHYYLQTSMDKI